MKNRRIGAKILATCIAATMLTAAIPAQAMAPTASAMETQSQTSISGPMGWQMGTGSSIYWAGATTWELAGGLRAYVNHYSGNLAFSFYDYSSNLEFTMNSQDDIGDPLGMANNFVCRDAMQLDVQNQVLSGPDGSKMYFDGQGKFGPYSLSAFTDRYTVFYGNNYYYEFDLQGRQTSTYYQPSNHSFMNMSKVTYFNPDDPDATYYDRGIKSIQTGVSTYSFNRYTSGNKANTWITDDNYPEKGNLFTMTKNATTGDLEYIATARYSLSTYDLENGKYWFTNEGVNGYLGFTTINVDGVDRISSIEYSPDGTEASAERTQFLYGTNMTIVINSDGSTQTINFDENGSPIA